MASSTPTTNRRPRRGGFTLAESLMAATILAATVSALVAPMLASYQQTENSRQSASASLLARQLLDEIFAKPYEDPTDCTMSLGPESGESGRLAFDNIDDYHGYSDVTSNMYEANGSKVDWPGKTNYTRSVNVEYRSSPQGPSASTGDWALVAVTVTTPDGTRVCLQRLASRYPRLLLTPP